ncbi:hypothetical protein [Camelliibacillus cellulosilyticus]|uniref:hypothetical protein n=1 Tax=Camelliibacillus cellulosilyticus TaxID=2174486 RepID=UPI00366CE127
MWIGHNRIPIAPLTYDQHGNLVERPPYSPLAYPPLGADPFSRDIFVVLLIGAKFTLGFSLLIAFFRVIIGSLIGVFLKVYLPKLGKYLLMPFENLNYFPIALFAYLFLKWILLDDGVNLEGKFTYDFWTRTWVDVAVLTILALPAVTQTVFNETGNIVGKEFIVCSKTLGGNRRHLLWTHIRPFLSPQLVLIYIREVIQVLLLLAHLGIFKIVAGGSRIEASFIENLPFTDTNDWASLFGSWFQLIWSGYYWLPFIPLLAVVTAILAMKGILLSMQQVDQNIEVNDVISKKTKRRHEEKASIAERSKPTAHSFEPVSFNATHHH